MVRSCILFTGEGGLFLPGLSVPKTGLSMITLPNLFSTTMALASDPSGSSSATLADASTVFPSFCCRSVTSPSKCVPRIPIVATVMLIRTFCRFLRAMSPLTYRNAPLRTLEVKASSPETPPAAWKYRSTSNSAFGPRVMRDLSVNSICRTVPAPVRMRSPAETGSPSASFRTGPPGACALLNWSPVIRDARPTEGVWASATAAASNRPRAIRLMPTEWSFISCLLDFHPSGPRHSAHERPRSQIRTPAVRYARRYGGPYHRDHRHTDARAFFRQFHFHDIERHRHYPSCAGPWLLPRRNARGPQAVGRVVLLFDRHRGFLGPAAAIPERSPVAGHRLQAVPDRWPADRTFPPL